jgi:hypothetical protein
LGATRIAAGTLILLAVTSTGFGDDSKRIKAAMARYEARHPGVLRVGGKVKAPKNIHHVAPDFDSLPPEKQRYSGPIMVYAVVDTAGTVVDPVIVSRAQPDLDAVVLKSIRQWRYEPARRAGKAVPVFLVTTVMF